MVENEPKNCQNYPENIKKGSVQDIRPIGNPEVSKCFQEVKTKFQESYLSYVYHFRIIQGPKMVKNEPKNSRNYPENIKNGVEASPEALGQP